MRDNTEKSAFQNNQRPTATLDARAAVLDKALADITKRYGESAILRMGEAAHMSIESIPTGSISLHIALGIGSTPYGRITEIYGPENSGKSTLCQFIADGTQRRDQIAAYIDMEHALDTVYAATCGVDVDNLLISQPDIGEQALEITETLVARAGSDSWSSTRLLRWSHGLRSKATWATRA